MLVGKVREGGVEHTVSTTSQAQNDQMIAVVETGRLSIEAGKKSLPILAGQSVMLPVEVRRGKGLIGEVRIDLILPKHITRITAKPITIGAGQSRGIVELRFEGTQTPSVVAVLRATIQTTDGAVTAETSVELVGP